MIAVNIRPVKYQARERQSGGGKICMGHTNGRRLYPVPAALPHVHRVRQWQAPIPGLNLLPPVLCSCEVGDQGVHPCNPHRGLQRKNPQRVRVCRGSSTHLVACRPGILILCIRKAVRVVLGMTGRVLPRQNQRAAVGLLPFHLPKMLQRKRIHWVSVGGPGNHQVRDRPLEMGGVV